MNLVQDASLMDDTCLSWGNANTAGQDHREWVTGLFVPEGAGLRHAPVEVKWSTRPKGWVRGWSDTSDRTSMTMVVSGVMKLDFEGEGEGSVILASPGDYVIWCPGTRHDCLAVTDCTVITFRWPSE